METTSSNMVDREEEINHILRESEERERERERESPAFFTACCFGCCFTVQTRSHRNRIGIVCCTEKMLVGKSKSEGE